MIMDRKEEQERETCLYLIYRTTATDAIKKLMMTSGHVAYYINIQTDYHNGQ